MPVPRSIGEQKELLHKILFYGPNRGGNVSDYYFLRSPRNPNFRLISDREKYICMIDSSKVRGNEELCNELKEELEEFSKFVNRKLIYITHKSLLDYQEKFRLEVITSPNWKVMHTPTPNNSQIYLDGAEIPTIRLMNNDQMVFQRNSFDSLSNIIDQGLDVLF